MKRWSAILSVVRPVVSVVLTWRRKLPFISIVSPVAVLIVLRRIRWRTAVIVLLLAVGHCVKERAEREKEGQRLEAGEREGLFELDERDRRG